MILMQVLMYSLARPEGRRLLSEAASSSSCSVNTVPAFACKILRHIEACGVAQTNNAACFAHKAR